MDNTNDASAVTISVHGTFAGDSQNEGEKWWQAGSAFAQKLGRYLPRGVRLASGPEVFHWSGENSERARSVAAAGLLKHLEQQEAEGKAYHLVGHSHGGSVIWHTLKLAEHAKKPLRGLRSWTTVGTPFLQHRSREAYSPTNLLSLLLTALLIKPAIRYTLALFGAARAAWSGDSPSLVAQHADALGYEAYLRAPLFWLLDSLGVPVVEQGSGTQVGSFDPNGDTSFTFYLFASYEGLVLVAMMMLTSYLFLNLAVHCIKPVIESHRIRAERGLEKRAFDRFGNKWLGLWSRDDEAINGLRATLDLSVSFVREMLPRRRVFASDTTSLIHSPLFWMVAPIYNRFIRPTADRVVRGIVVRSAQGNDRPAAELVEVTPTPLSDVRPQGPIPERLNDQLVRYSNEHARDIAPKLRCLIGQPSFALGLESFGDELSGKELIHTSYFEHDDIAALIACQVTCVERREPSPKLLLRLPHDLRLWFASQRRVASGDATSLPTWLSGSPPRLRQAA